MAEHNELGTKGENTAVEFLQNNGHEILARNFKHGKVEIDIISMDEELLVFTEVKTRSTDYFGYPEESVDKKKRKKIKRAAEEYMFQHQLETGVRFDIVSITNVNGKLKVYHIKDAFFNEAETDDEGYE
jgi:putative endonuclease